jgi:hypothetical protein
MTLVVTIAFSFSIYWLQLRHEKETQKIVKSREHKELEEKAKLFLIDNEAERDYLPWCVIAANIHRLDKHTREIYNSFCRCPEELRNEILKQAGFEMESIKGQTWVNDCIEALEKDIQKYNLGRDYLYDGAKYFHRSYERYRDLKWNSTPQVFEPICKDNHFRISFGMDKLDIGSYIDEYFYYFIDKRIDLKEGEPIPPIDFVWNSQNLAYTNEETVCMWMMELIQDIAIIIYNRGGVEKINGEILECTDAQVETYEDKYYATLQALYNAYYIKHMDEKRVSRKKKNRKAGSEHNG